MGREPDQSFIRGGKAHLDRWRGKGWGTWSPESSPHHPLGITKSAVPAGKCLFG
ncbi:LOW QUALITY PROTEIN: hypothetical protein PanWU01x14_112550 [Parasponia andersonii]|uniref:Uncharacterized protein n=1 Tax=Parasponia andersonii TaxID=3476 RepID=A0A2P5CYA9_PARAD|nr:LOW QUALITY PROTEIN: hypothetical protein PanWU01x14_112550 [Parasponia andersonii]